MVIDELIQIDSEFIQDINFLPMSICKYRNALSRCPNWEHIQIATLDRSAFITDPDMIREYEPGTMIFCDSQNTTEFPLNAANYIIGFIPDL